jgi:membrane-associated progesterone receptor component
MTMYSALLYGLLLALPALYLFRLYHRRSTPIQPSKVTGNDPPKTIMQAPQVNLPPPKNDPFTVDQLKKYDGSDPNVPIYVAIKGEIEGEKMRL